MVQNDTTKENLLWTEKYRPRLYQDLEAADYLKRFLAHSIENGHPHLLLYGPPGTGKTTFAQMLNPTIVLNASDERGIDVIRNKIKKVANTLRKEVIFLDECENLSRDAQTCLRRIMEDYKNTSFIFATNYYNRIINPLKSRLLKLKFSGVKSNILNKIAENEKLNLNSEFCKTLFKKCKGDLRRCINVMQGIRPLCKSIESNENAKIELTDAELDYFIGRIPNELVDIFYETNKSNYEHFVQAFIDDGYSTLQLIQQLAEVIEGNEREKSFFSILLAECEGYSINGCSDELVLRSLILNRISIYSK